MYLEEKWLGWFRRSSQTSQMVTTKEARSQGLLGWQRQRLWVGLKLGVQRNTQEQGRSPCFKSIAICHLSPIFRHFSSILLWPKPHNCEEAQLWVTPAIAKPNKGISWGATHKLHRDPDCSANGAAAQKPGSSAEPREDHHKESLQRPNLMMGLTGTCNLCQPSGKEQSWWESQSFIANYLSIVNWLYILGPCHVLSIRPSGLPLCISGIDSWP